MTTMIASPSTSRIAAPKTKSTAKPGVRTARKKAYGKSTGISDDVLNLRPCVFEGCDLQTVACHVWESGNDAQRKAWSRRGFSRRAGAEMCHKHYAAKRRAEAKAAKEFEEEARIFAEANRAVPGHVNSISIGDMDSIFEMLVEDRIFPPAKMPDQPQFRAAPWTESSVCSQTDPEVFFEAHAKITERIAIKMCGTCPVRLECLTAAVQNRERWGTWGGLGQVDLQRLFARLDVVSGVKPVEDIDEEDDTDEADGGAEIFATPEPVNETFADDVLDIADDAAAYAA